MSESDVIAQAVLGSSRRPLERVLWLHRTDRWYFGDFLRHAGWLSWLRDVWPLAVVDLASHPAYLGLYDDVRFGRRLDVRGLDSGLGASYDLVIVPGVRESEPADLIVPLLLMSWDTGWSLRVDGRIEQRGSKTELNYFRAAHPSGPAEPVTLPVTPPRFSSSEVEVVDQALSRLLPGSAPVIVYNPTASNAFTRATKLPKEVDNALDAREHAVILRRLLVVFPDHEFIVGSALKSGDTANAEMVESLTRCVESNRVVGIEELGLAQLRSLRGFASLLASKRVCSTVGSGTGTNTHLAALLDVPSLSVERGVDAAMLANWSSDQFQMGSFRWRNPATCTAIHTMDWAGRTEEHLEAVAESFLAHHALHRGPTHKTIFTDVDAVPTLVNQFHAQWPGQPAEAVEIGQRLLALMHETARAHYGDFGDEAAYLALGHGLRATGLGSLAMAMVSRESATRRIGVQLFQDSNLHKLFIRLRTLPSSSTMSWVDAHA